MMVSMKSDGTAVLKSFKSARVRRTKSGRRQVPQKNDRTKALRRFRRVASDWDEKIAHGPAHAGSAGAAWPMRGFSMLRGI